jgi:hypothetical protein
MSLLSRLMKLSNFPSGMKTAPLLAAMCGLGLLVPSVVAQINDSSRGAGRVAAGSTGPSATLTIPLSVFVIPDSAKEGKDPFFPLSTRRAPPEVIETNSQPIVSFDLHLKGISGPTDSRLAIVNNRTLQAGEEAEVTTSNGRVRIRCLDIKRESVVIQIGPERRELRLRPGI